MKTSNDKSCHTCIFLNPFHLGYSLSQLTMVKRQGTQWIGHYFRANMADKMLQNNQAGLLFQSKHDN